MKINYQNICFLILFVSLSGCPYKEVYKPIEQTTYIINGLKITPVIVFFNAHKGIATCGVNLRFNNQNDSIQRVVFSKSYLINLKDTLKIENIYAWMAPLPKEYVFHMASKKDTALEFVFKDLEKNFGDTIKLTLNISGVGKNTFIYKKVR